MADFFCFWESAGGPEFSSETLTRIGSLDIYLGIDIYFADR